MDHTLLIIKEMIMTQKRYRVTASPADVISGQVGQAEKNISRLFDQLRKKEKAVLFIDEIESLVPRRKANRSTIMQRVISQILSEIDGLSGRSEGNTLFIIGATNEVSMIDPAMLRPGRFDTCIYVGPPNHDARRTLLQSALMSRPISGNLNIEELANRTEDMTGAEINELANKAADILSKSCLFVTNHLGTPG